MKYKPELVREMVSWVEENGLIDHGGATFKSFCQHFGIDDMTFYKWMHKSDFSEAIEKAKDIFKSRLEKKLVDSLARAAEGYTAETSRTEYVNDPNGKPIINKKIVEKKPVAPNVAAAIYLLGNLSPERWKNRQSSEITGADGEPLSQSPITIQISEAGKKVEVEK